MKPNAHPVISKRTLILQCISIDWINNKINLNNRWVSLRSTQPTLLPPLEDMTQGYGRRHMFGSPEIKPIIWLI